MQTHVRAIAVLALAGAIGGSGTGCGGAGQAPMLVSVVVSPRQASVVVGRTVSFTATVTGAPVTSVHWSVQETGGGNVDSRGYYTAPASPGTFHLVATSDADAFRSDTATVTVTPATSAISVSIAPRTASVVAGGTQLFAASVTGTTAGQSTAVTWSVQEVGGGTVDSSGYYVAPSSTGTYHVVATSVADSSKSAAATVTVTATPVIAVSISPASGSTMTGGTLQFTATVTGTTAGQSTAVTWSVQEGAAGGTVSAGLYTAPAAAGTYHVVATSVANTSKSAVAAVTVALPVIAVSVSPQIAETAPAGALSFTATVTGAVSGQSTAVTWSIQEGAGGGTVDASGHYTAPMTEGTYHVVATSVADPSKSSAANVGVTALSIIPADRRTTWNPGVPGGIPARTGAC